MNEIINGPITADEIEKAIKRLKNNKASSEDEIINEYIKHSSQKMILLYVKVFNAIFNCGKLPEAWLKGKNLLGDEYCVRPNVIKFKKLMTSKNVPVLRKLCHFIKIIFSIACPP